ncbi:bcl-2-modifying factor isoform X4 [Poecile atricapillus]|uniref:bcl-2-modifying factor isoform X4 n=1 Tax=Poecile atricapillus TaxID=48891 RepID=UPI002739A641|nr:bcl-2-modifying factor isoform X4 [Poecile atricapillus]
MLRKPEQRKRHEELNFTALFGTGWNPGDGSLRSLSSNWVRCTGAMDRPSYLEEDYSSLDGLDDDVFHSDDFGLAGQPGEMTATGFFTQNQSYSCLLGRFQLFPLTHCCGPGIRHPEQQDKATQTLSPSSSSQDVMLPCGVTEEPRRLFYGSAGYRLHVPPADFVLDPHLQEEPQEGQREARAEVQIARKLQCIADQFHRLHIQRIKSQPIQRWSEVAEAWQ